MAYSLYVCPEPSSGQSIISRATERTDTHHSVGTLNSLSACTGHYNSAASVSTESVVGGGGGGGSSSIGGGGGTKTTSSRCTLHSTPGIDYQQTSSGTGKSTSPTTTTGGKIYRNGESELPRTAEEEEDTDTTPKCPPSNRMMVSKLWNSCFPEFSSEHVHRHNFYLCQVSGDLVVSCSQLEIQNVGTSGFGPCNGWCKMQFLLNT